MLRYCINCQKDFEFAPLDVSGGKTLICPECGNVIDNNSRHPVNKEELEQGEETVGRIMYRLMRLSYIFYMLLAVMGVIFYVLHLDKPLYTVTAVALIAFLIQLITRTLNFTSGIVFLPAGAALGYWLFKDFAGACLGIHIVFLIRHIIRDILYELLFKFIRMGS